MKACMRLVLLVFVLAGIAHVAAQDPPEVPATGPISVLLYGAKGDGTTDDAAAIQRAMDLNPTRTIFLPDRRPQQEPDYFCSKTLVLRGASQVLCGESAGYLVGTFIKFPAGVSAILVRNDTGPGALVKDLIVEGSEQWIGVYANEVVLPRGFGGDDDASAADGICVGANFARCENVTARYFGRHGFNVGDSQGEGLLADNFRLVNCSAFNNRGCGLHIAGGDSNAGTTIQFVANSNQLYGFYDRSFLGNTHISPQTHNNHSAMWASPEVRAEIEAKWAALGVEGSPFRSDSAVGNTWLHPYVESDQAPCMFKSNDVVIGGDIGTEAGSDHFWINNGAHGIQAASTPFLSMTTGKDVGGQLWLKAGKTSPQHVYIHTVNPDNSIRWDEIKGAQGQGWSVWEGRAWGGGTQRFTIMPNGGPIQLVGPVTIDGREVKPNPPERVRVQKTIRIAGGKSVAIVPHDLGGQPAVEDIGFIPGGPLPIWVASVDATNITVRINPPAPASGRVFTISASRQP